MLLKKMINQIITLILFNCMYCDLLPAFPEIWCLCLLGLCVVCVL